jgi:uncharacterized membrane protein (Fun14 family)
MTAMSDWFHRVPGFDPKLAAGSAKADLIQPWRESSSLRLALMMMLVGLAWWIFRPARPPEREPRSTAGTIRESATTTVPNAESNVVPKPRRLAPTSPALLRFGGGYCGGFLIGFLFRRFLKITALIAAAVFSVITLLKWTGLIELDWAAIEAHVHESLAWTQGKLSGLKTLLTGYLPSAAAGAVGLWKGLRWQSTAPPSWPERCSLA